MKNVFEYANGYIKSIDWRDMALLKICLCAAGILIGLSIPKNKKKFSFAAACVIFTVSYITLMAKFTKIVIQETKETK